MKTADKSTKNLPARQDTQPLSPLDIIPLLPQKPGAYKFYDKNGQILYVGKAKNLKNRVSSYFRKTDALAPDKKRMVRQIAKAEWLVVNSETEALLLEANLIKKFNPKYNIILKDDSSFLYIKINLSEDYPTVSLTRKRESDKCKYFGPYTSALNARQFLKNIKFFLPIKTCANKPDKLCFEARLGRCAGHNFGPGSKQVYHNVLKSFKKICSGHTAELTEELKTKMKQAAALKNFELAKKYRDEQNYLKIFNDRQIVIASPQDNTDVWHITKTEGGALATRLIIRNGKMIDAHHLKMAHTVGQSEADLYYSLLSLFYSGESSAPKQIISGGILTTDDKFELEKLFKTKISYGKTGRNKKLLALALANGAEAELRQRPSWLKKENAGYALQKFLSLKTPPMRVECYDISNLAGKHSVGSMVAFVKGLPDKTQYRHFVIEGFKKQNDPAMISQILNRRLNHSDWTYPDLIVLDGGRGQLAIADKYWPPEIKKIPMVALAKKLEEIYLLNSKLRLDRRNPALKLLQRLRDEAHRFAITYNRKKRLKTFK